MNLRIRKAEINDFDFLVKLEADSFPVFQRSSNQSIKRGIRSEFQEILIAETNARNKVKIGALVLFKYSKSVRIYSLAILQEYRNKGYGDQLLTHVFEMVNQQQYEKILIEVSAKNTKLIDWYLNRGFNTIGAMHDYYCEGEDAIKMEFRTNGLAPSSGTNNIIVINHPHKWTFTDINAKVVSVKEYINNPVYQTNSDYRVFNLCSSYKYQTYGYYVSLLASARDQRVIPSLITIRDFRILDVIHSVAFEIDDLINESLDKETVSPYILNIYFGQTNAKGFASLAMKLYQLFEVPLFGVEFVKNGKWTIKKLEVITLNKVQENELSDVYEFAKRYFNKKRFSKTKLINYKYDIAILIDPNESTPPSCPTALQKFKNAANRKGLYVEFIGKSDFDKLNEFDALFIRETTSVMNHTYEFSRFAYAEGLVVIDDPWSILRCSNKIYQNELFKKHKLLTPQTTILTKNLFEKKILSQMNYPFVLKQPDSAFSLGVTKVANEKEALIVLEDLFRKSDMVVCQEFLYSDFDWRIGILDNTPIFACKYYMSKGHWQIYNWKGEEEDHSGEFETLSIDMVPDIVLRTALKASALIGDGLYGVDLKLVNGKVYVIEVNDNPNVDEGVEDLVLKDQLYEIIIDSIYNRIELAKNVQKIDLR